MRKEDLKKSIGYGLAAFVLAAFCLGVITSPNWHEAWWANGAIVLNVRPLLAAMVIGIVALAMVALGFNRAPAALHRVDLIARLFCHAAMYGILFFMGWVGIGMFQLMDAS